MNGNSPNSVTSCLTEAVLARIAVGDVLVGEEKANADLHLESCEKCCSRLDQRLSASLAGLPKRSDEPEPCDDEKMNGLVRKLMESERRGELQLHDKSILDHLATGNGPCRFAHFELIRHISTGGMGSVFEGRDTKLGRRCALKLINSGVYASESEIDRFMREANAAASLDHPSIVTVFGVGEHCDSSGPVRHFVVMELVQGEGLDKKIRNGTKLGERQVAIWMKQVAEGLAHAHGNDQQSDLSKPDKTAQGFDRIRRARIVHRDIKPGNILIDQENRAKIIDFGLAKVSSVELAITLDGMLIGTPAYMAPEQTSEGLDEVGPGSDIFSLGVVMYELLTGQRPFPGNSRIETFNLICQHEPIAPQKLNRMISRDLETICLKCLEKEPSRRYATATALAEDLEAFLVGRAVTARRIGRTGKLWKWCKRNPSIAGTQGLLAISCLALMWFAMSAYSSGIRHEESQKLLAATTEDREQEDYLYKVRTAGVELANNRLDLMERILKSCPDGRRDLEWYLLNNNFLHQEIFGIEESSEKSSAICWSPDGSRLLVIREKSVESWDVEQGLVANSFPIDEPGNFAISWRKQLLATGNPRTSTIELTNMKDGLRIRSLTGLEFEKEGTPLLAIDENGKWLVGGTSSTICVWESESGTVLRTWPMDAKAIRSLDFHPTEPWVVAVFEERGDEPGKDGLTIWEIPTGKRVRDFASSESSRWLRSSDIHPDGKWMVTGCYRSRFDHRFCLFWAELLSQVEGFIVPIIRPACPPPAARTRSPQPVFLS